MPNAEPPSSTQPPVLSEQSDQSLLEQLSAQLSEEAKIFLDRLNEASTDGNKKQIAHLLNQLRHAPAPLFQATGYNEDVAFQYTLEKKLFGAALLLMDEDLWLPRQAYGQSDISVTRIHFMQGESVPESVKQSLILRDRLNYHGDERANRSIGELINSLEQFITDNSSEYFQPARGILDKLLLRLANQDNLTLSQRINLSSYISKLILKGANPYLKLIYAENNCSAIDRIDSGNADFDQERVKEEIKQMYVFYLQMRYILIALDEFGCEEHGPLTMRQHQKIVSQLLIEGCMNQQDSQEDWLRNPQPLQQLILKLLNQMNKFPRPLQEMREIKELRTVLLNFYSNPEVIRALHINYDTELETILYQLRSELLAKMDRERNCTVFSAWLDAGAEMDKLIRTQELPNLSNFYDDIAELISAMKNQHLSPDQKYHKFLGCLDRYSFDMLPLQSLLACAQVHTLEKIQTHLEGIGVHCCSQQSMEPSHIDLDESNSTTTIVQSLLGVLTGPLRRSSSIVHPYSSNDPTVGPS